MNANDYSVKTIPLKERPRERFLELGSEAVSSSELIAIILGNGTKGKSVVHLSQELISKFETLNGLAEATIAEICEVKGMGKAKAMQIKAALTLAMRLSQTSLSAKYKIDHPLRAYNLLKDILEKEKRELFVVILLDTKSCLINHHIVSIGTLSRSLVHPREVFYPAIRHKAASLLLAHNHPSGDPTPSKEDINITKTLIEVGEMMGMPVKDHIIIGNNKYISLKEQNLGF